MRNIKSTLYIPCILLLFLGVAGAQQPQPDPFAGNLFPPELIMQHQQAIGLSEEQRTFLKTELRNTQTRLADLQWSLQEEVEKLAAMVKRDQIDDGGALNLLDSVLAVEREIKRTHIGLLIRIKNRLTPEQKARLREIANTKE
jgi:Spy/CpxP family protein refolding chaperone